MASSSFLSSLSTGSIRAHDEQRRRGSGGTAVVTWMTQLDAMMDTSTGHRHDGTDARVLQFATTSQLDTSRENANSEGVLTFSSRGDHRHGVTYGTTNQLAAPSNFTTAPGTAQYPARVDHIHPLNYGTTNQLDDSRENANAAGTSKIIARMDHRHGVTYGTTNQLAAPSNFTTAPGTAQYPARIDHIHPLNYGTTNQLDDSRENANAAGTSKIVARMDHRHGVTYGTTNQIDRVTAAAGSGTDQYPARIDHTHAYDQVTERDIVMYDQTPANGVNYMGGGTTGHQWHPEHTVLVTAFRLQSRTTTTIAETGVLVDLNGFAGGFTVIDTQGGTTSQDYTPTGCGNATTIAENNYFGKRYAAAGTTTQRSITPITRGLYFTNAGAPGADQLTLTVAYVDYY